MGRGKREGSRGCGEREREREGNTLRSSTSCDCRLGTYILKGGKRNIKKLENKNKKYIKKETEVRT